jgi:hypothetical protein
VTDAIFADGTTLPEYLEEVSRLVVGQYKNSRERSLVLTKLEEAGLWMTKCEPAEKVEVFTHPEVIPSSEKMEEFKKEALEQRTQRSRTWVE